MDTSYREFLRISPYQLANILKYEPTALLSDSDIKSSLEIHAHKTKLSSAGLAMPVQQSTPTNLNQPCYFCSAKGENCSWKQCGECRKVVCESCVFRCGKCEKTLCQLDKTYDYNLECVCCFNC